MAGGERRWLRLDSGWMNSEWIMALDEGPRLAWICLMTYVKNQGINGRAKALSSKVFAKIHFLKEASAEILLKAAKADGALEEVDGTWILKNWATYQTVDPTNAERQKRHRNALRNDSNGDNAQTAGNMQKGAAKTEAKAPKAGAVEKRQSENPLGSIEPNKILQNNNEVTDRNALHRYGLSRDNDKDSYIDKDRIPQTPFAKGGPDVPEDSQTRIVGEPDTGLSPGAASILKQVIEAPPEGKQAPVRLSLRNRMPAPPGDAPTEINADALVRQEMEASREKIAKFKAERDRLAKGASV